MSEQKTKKLFDSIFSFLDYEIEKCLKYGKRCNIEDHDLLRACSWYAASEAFSIIKEKMSEISIETICFVEPGDHVKAVGDNDWVKVLRVNGSDIYLELGDGLNCYGIDDIIAWRKLKK